MPYQRKFRTMKQSEIRKTGYQALIDALGVVGMLRFLQLDAGSGDYTQERYQTSEPTLEKFRQCRTLTQD